MANNSPTYPWNEADAMYLLLMRRVSDIENSGPVGSSEEELDCILSVLDAYEAKRFERDTYAGAELSEGRQPEKFRSWN